MSTKTVDDHLRELEAIRLEMARLIGRQCSVECDLEALLKPKPGPVRRLARRLKSMVTA